MIHEDYKALLPFVSLSSVDGEEAIALEQHLETCADCRAELDEWRGTAGALAYSVEPLEPSAGVRERILAAVHAEAQIEKVNNVVPISRPSVRQQLQPRRTWGFEAIAAAVIFVGLLIGLVALWRQNVRTHEDIARLQEQMRVTSSQLDQKEKLIQMLATPGARMASLAGTKEAPSAHGMLAVDSKSGKAVFMAQGLPPAPAGMAYQLWFIAGKRPPMPGGVFKTNASGEAMMDDQLSPDALTAGVFAVTLEPQDGVRAPTGAMYLVTPS